MRVERSTRSIDSVVSVRTPLCGGSTDGHVSTCTASLPTSHCAHRVHPLSPLLHIFSSCLFHRSGPPVHPELKFLSTSPPPFLCCLCCPMRAIVAAFLPLSPIGWLRPRPLRRCSRPPAWHCSRLTMASRKPSNDGLTKRVCIIGATCLYSGIGPRTTLVSV